MSLKKMSSFFRGVSPLHPVSLRLRLGSCRGCQHPQSQISQLHSLSDFSLSQPSSNLQVGSEVGGWAAEQRNEGGPCPRPGIPSAASDQPGNKRSSGTRECPRSRSQATFPNSAARGRVGGGDCPRAADRPPRNRPEWPWAPAASTHWAPLFHQQFQENLPKAVMPHCNV